MKSDPVSHSKAPLSTAAQYVLLALAARDLHGYGIVQEVPQLSGGTYRLGPGTLYDTLKRLMNAGLVADAPRHEIDRDERRFYQITPEGRRLLSLEMARLETLVAMHAKLRKPRTA